MKLLLRCFFLVSLFSSSAFAQTLKFNISKTGYPPYTINNPNEAVSGIFMEVLQRIAGTQGHEIEVISLPRKRVTNMMLNEDVDLTLAAVEWIRNADDFVFTDGILNSRDVLFSLRKAPLLFDRVEDLYGSSLSTHLGYYYPFLDSAFDSGKIIRRDALSFESMLKLTFSKRTDAVVINRDVGLWMIKNNPEFQGKFLSSNKAINTFKLRLMFNKKWQPFVNTFNEQLALMRESGELREIVISYR
jgi:polar amino acid transport system substrate-binding protein